MKTMPDKYINASRLIRKLEYVRKSGLAELVGNPTYAGTAAEVRMYQIYDGMIDLLKKRAERRCCPGKTTGMARLPTMWSSDGVLRGKENRD